MVIQQVYSHNACCYKVYAFLGEPFMNLRTSLKTEDIKLEGNNWYDMMSNLSENKYELEAMDSIVRLCLLNPELVNFMVRQFHRIGNISSFGLDL